MREWSLTTRYHLVTCDGMGSVTVDAREVEEAILDALQDHRLENYEEPKAIVLPCEAKRAIETHYAKADPHAMATFYGFRLVADCEVVDPYAVV